ISAYFHLNGLIFLVAGFLYCLWQRSFKDALIFGVVGTAAASVFVWDAVLSGNIQTLMYQFAHDPATTGSRSFGSKIETILKSQAIFFHSGGEIATTMLAITGAWLSFGRTDVPSIRLGRYTLALLIAFLL